MNKTLNPVDYINLIFILTIAVFAAPAQDSAESQILQPNQTIEREMIGKVTHRYKFDLKADEFFQVRVEQKGIDVELKLLETNGNILATMDSPNGKEGFETLTWVSSKDGSFILEVISPNEKAEKGNYSIKREPSRTATENDKQQVKIEKNFVAGVVAVTEISKEFAKADKILNENFKIVERSKTDAVSSRIKLQEALVIYRAIKPKTEDESLYSKISQFGGKESQQLLAIIKRFAVLSVLNEALLLDRIAQTHYYVGEWGEYLEYKKNAVISYQDLLKFKNDLEKNEDGKKLLIAIKSSIAGDLDNIGSAIYSRLGQLGESIKYSEQSAELYGKLYLDTGDDKYKIRQGISLANIAFSYGDQSQYKLKAIEYYTKSLEIFRTIPKAKSYVAELLSLIGSAYMSLENYLSARKYLEESFEVYRELNNKQGQSSILNSLAVMSLTLNDQTKFKEFINQTLAILESPDYEENAKKNFNSNLESIFSISMSDDVQGELRDNLLKRSRLQSIAFCYELLKDYQKALDYNKQTLEVVRSSKEPVAVRSGLRDVAYILAKLERWNEAADYYQQAIKVSRQTQDKEALAADLQNLGWTLLEAGKPIEALTNQNEALTIYQSVGVNENNAFSSYYGNLLNEISRTHYALGNKRLAILYGKRAINAIQGERQRFQNLDPISQKGFLENKEKHYRRLADWLFEEGRFAEAEQVLRMLKEEEFSQFVRRDPEEINKLGQRLDLKPDETRAIEKYSLIADNLAKIGVEYEKLLKEKGGIANCLNDSRCNELKEQLKAANTAFDLFLKQDLVKEFDKAPKKEINKAEFEKEISRRALLKEENAVSIYTLVGEDRLRVFLTTSQIQTDRKKEITAKELNQKIRAFRNALQNPNVDPRPLGKELYDLLIAPIEKQIQDSGAKTLLFSLDGSLRYIPIAALWDGEKYLVEKYQIVLLTSATKERLHETKNNADWKIFGGGVTEESEVTEPERKGFKGLPSVKTELDSIVSDNGAQGLFAGKKYIDKDFTKENLEDGLLGNKFNILHLATHFNLGRDNRTSFLLLGNNQTLTLQQIKVDNDIELGNVDLVVLSACETAFGNSNNEAEGGEVDSSAAFFELKGAKSVIASLWSVADDSTSQLMINFYQIRRENPQLSKAEALRLAQLKLLNGSYKTVETAAWRGAKIVAGNNSLPTFKPDPNAPFAHPYYWSPFILIGNWK